MVMAFCLVRTSEAKDGYMANNDFPFLQKGLQNNFFGRFRGCPDETFPVCGMNLQDYGSPCLAGADGTVFQTLLF